MKTTAKKPTMWWVSWEERESPDDSRPLKSPPNPAVLAWWETGIGEDYVTMVALVLADSTKGVADAIANDWPSKGARKWRFQYEKVTDADGSLSLSDRFPLGDWSTKRLKAIGITAKVIS